MIEWLAEVAQRVREPLELPGGNIMTDAALRAGWTVLRSAMRSWEIQSTDHLSAWLGRQGFPRVSPGNHISARAQEFLLGEAVSFDARTTWLEAVFVMVTIQTGRELTVATPHVHEPQRRVVQNRVPTTGGLINSGSWEQLDQIDLGEAFLHRVPMLRSCPRFLRGRLRFSFGVALQERCRAKLAGDIVAETRAWKLFGLIPTLLLRRPRHGGTTGRDELAQRMDDFANGMWGRCLRKQGSTSVVPASNTVDDHHRRGEAAQSRVQRGQVSRARHELTGAPLAPKTMETLNELRARRPQARQSPLPQEAVDFKPQSPLSLDGKIFAKCLRTSPSGSSPGPGGCTNEMLRVCLDDPEILDLLTSAAEDFARAAVPAEITRCFMLASMTALQKRDGGARGAAPVFAVLSLKLWPDSSERRWRRLVPCSSLPFPPGLGWIASVTQCEWRQTRILKPPSCPSTASAHTTMFFVVP